MKIRRWLGMASMAVLLGAIPACGDDDDDAVVGTGGRTSSGGRTGTGGVTSSGGGDEGGETAGGSSAKGGSTATGGRTSSAGAGGLAGEAGATSAEGGSGGGETLGDIVETAMAASPEFESLVAAVAKAELVDTLKGDGPFTVFAPTDAAFAELFSALDVELSDLSKEDLTPILLYHVVPSSVPASSVVKLSHATTAGGGDVSIKVDAGKVFLNGDVQVITTDIQASNGVIHVIDKVLVPPADIPTVASSNDEFDSLVAALTRAELVDALKDDGPFTVFAPTNAAFSAFLTGIGKTLNQLTKEELTPILLYHVVPGKVYSDAAVGLAGKSAKTLNEDAEIAISVANGKVKLNADATVTATDIVSSNGVIHVIDKVLVPE